MVYRKTFKRVTEYRPHRLARPRTPAFHAGDRGSNPLGDASITGVNPEFNLINPVFL